MYFLIAREAENTPMNMPATNINSRHNHQYSLIKSATGIISMKLLSLEEFLIDPYVIPIVKIEATKA